LHATVGRGRQPEGGDAGSRTGEAREGKEGAGRWAGPWGAPPVSERRRERVC
jgi:hypothetical protein